MGAGCNHDTEIPDDRPEIRRILLIVIAINAAMFVVEVVASMQSGSLALLSDSLDFAGDAATYAISLAVLSASLRVRSWSAIVKAGSMALFGLWILGAAIRAAIIGDVPDATTMSAVGGLALVANLVSVLFLLRFRTGDANLRSVWLCSRNDAINNVAVILAGAGVFASASRWPDLAVASIMALLAFWSAVSVLRQARHELRHGAPGHA
ncbi:MAG: cation transporter [Minwuia sp.]|nr:cation transporter [Minwuia sp.]